MKAPYTLYKNSSILLPDIAIPELPAEITLEGQELFVKDEFHITLVSARYLAGIINRDDQDSTLRQILQEFDAFVETTSFEDYVISDELRFVRSDQEKTIVVMADVLRLEEFFVYLSQQFSIELPKQQTHVTLYRYPEDFIGISIPSPEVLQAISRPVEIPELSKQFEKGGL